jgi:hypothetical protein
MMSKSAKWLVAVLGAITAASVVAVVFMAAQRAGEDEQDAEESVRTPSHVSVRDGRTVITLDPDTQTREGIRVVPLAQTSMRAQLRGTAILLAATDLAAVRNNYVAGRARLEREQVDLHVFSSQYERVKTLYQQNENMSLKAMEDAEAAFRGSQAQVKADEQDVRLQLNTAGQRWGAVVADWVASGGPVLERILEQRECLVQLVFPPGEIAAPPATVSLAAPANHLVQARFVSPFPQVDPQIQGVSFLYRVPNRPGLAAGMNLVAFVPVGQLLHGTVIPASALVWWQGRAWAYEAVSPDTFARREVPTGSPVAGGYFVSGGTFAPGARLVIAGAQALLSEEFRSQIQQEQ